METTLVIGDRIEVLRPLEVQYSPGTVSDVTNTCMHVISYNDGDRETLTLSSKTWRSCTIIAAIAKQIIV